MKNLSRVLIFSLLALISTQTFAQKFGIQGGINLANQVWKDDDDTYSDDFKMNLGFNAGVTFEIGFGNLIAVEAGLIADTKGFKWDDAFGYDGLTAKYNLLYVDVPVLIKVGPSFGPMKVFGAAGPYIGYGVTGTVKAEGDGESDSEDIKWGSSDDSDLKPLDFGAKFGAGAEIAGFTFGAYYSLGLANLAPVTDGGGKIQNRVLSISVGYKFGK